MTSLDSINGLTIQTLLRGENDPKQSDEFQAMFSPKRTVVSQVSCVPWQNKKEKERVNESDERTVIKMRLNKIFNTVNNKERGQSFGSIAVSCACITSMCSVQRFPEGYSLYSSTDKSL